mgnify:CR=1 FL=1
MANNTVTSADATVAAMVNRAPLVLRGEGVSSRVVEWPSQPGVAQLIMYQQQRIPSADDLADRAGLVAGAAQRDLVVFHARPVEAQNADMADMVMAAGIDAAGDVDVQPPDQCRGLGRLTQAFSDPSRRVAGPVAPLSR